MDFFVIDTVGDSGDSRPKKKPKVLLPKARSVIFDGTAAPPVEPEVTVKEEQEEESEDDDYGGLPPPGESISKILCKDADDVSSVLDVKKRFGKFPAFHVDTGASGSSKAGRIRRGITKENELNQTDVAAEMRKAVMTPAIEKKEDIARLAMSGRKLEKLNREERKKTKGAKWFDMAAPEMTPELSNELQLIKMRSVLDPKKVFGRVEKRKAPKYFEVGTVIDSPLEHFNERGTKKAKKQTLVDELLADAEFQKFNKRKYAEALEKKKKKAYHKAAVKMKKDKKKRR